MSFNTFAKEKLSQLLFLEIDGDGFVKSLGKDPKEVNINEVYIPIDPKHLSQDVKSGYKLESLPINYLVEGMFFALGGDKDFKFNKEYKKLIPLIEDAIPCVKKIVADKVKEENMVEAFMLLKGLTEISDETEVYENLLLICESLRERNKAYNETQLEICDKCKANRSDLALPYLYSAIAYNDMGQYDKAYVDINEYLAKGGERNEIVEVLYNEIKDFLNSNGIEIKDYVAKSRTNMLARTLLYINTINIEKMHQINNSLLELIKNNDNNEDDVYIKKILNKYARNGNDE